MKSIMTAFPLILARIGDPSAIQAGGTAGEAVADFNNFLKTIGVAIGVIILLVGIVKLIMASMEENAKAKQDASLLFGISIMFISMSSVLTSLGVENINGNTTVQAVASNVIGLLGNVLTYAGAILAIVSIVTLILSISQENPEQQASGVKLLTTAIGLLAANSLVSAISEKLLAESEVAATDYMDIAVGWFADIITYAGGGFVLIGVFRIVMGLRTEDSKERENGIKFLMVGIAFVAFRAILELFGITAA